jgi:hypothetical protein
VADAINCGLTVYQCPPWYAQIFLDAIEEHGLDGPTDGGIRLGETYDAASGSATTGAAFDICVALAPTLAECAWEVWQGVTYEGHPGRIFRHTPLLGTWEGSCDNEGDPALTDSQIKKIFAKYESNSARVFALGRELGHPWAEAFEQYPAGEIVRPPKLHEVVWDRRTGTVEIGDDEFEGPTYLGKDARDIAHERAEGVRILRDWLAARGWRIYVEHGIPGHGLTVSARGRIWEWQVYRTDVSPAAPAGGAQ